MKLRNNKKITFLGKNLPKRQRIGTKTSIESKTEELQKPIVVEVESKNIDPNPISTLDVSSYSSKTPRKGKIDPRSGVELIPSSSESDSSELSSDQVELIEQSSYEEDSRINQSLRRFSRGTPRSSRRSQLNSTMDKGTNTTNGKYGEIDNPTEFSFSFSQVEHQSTILDETPPKDYTTTSPPPVRFLSPTMETESDTEDEMYHEQLRNYRRFSRQDGFPIPNDDESDEKDLTVFDFNSDVSNEVSLIPETDSDDSDLPRRSFDPIALGAKADGSQAAADDKFDRIQGNMAKWTDAITTGFYDSNQNHSDYF